MHLWEHFGRTDKTALITCLNMLNVSSAFLTEILKFRRVTIRGAQPSARLSEEICLSEGSAGVSQRALRGSLRGFCRALRGSAGVHGIFRGFPGVVTLCFWPSGAVGRKPFHSDLTLSILKLVSKHSCLKVSIRSLVLLRPQEGLDWQTLSIECFILYWKSRFSQCCASRSNHFNLQALWASSFLLLRSRRPARK